MTFDDRSMNVNDDIIQETTPLIANTDQHYRRIRTTAFIVIHILLVVKKKFELKINIILKSLVLDCI
jgi:hypothetical protein